MKYLYKIWAFTKYHYTHITLVIITFLSMCIIICTTDKLCVSLINILYSIIAAAIFYLIVDYLPFVRKRKSMRILINSKLSELNELIRLCKEIPTSRFNMKSTTYKDCKEYAEEFYKIDLEEKSIFSSSQTWKEYLESHKEQIVENVVTLLNFSDYLTEKELKNLTLIKSSIFIVQPIFPKNNDLTEDIIDSYPNNQKEIGESIYKIHELIKGIK